MSFNLSDIRGSLNKHSYLKPNLFDVELTPPPIMNGKKLIINNTDLGSSTENSISEIPKLIKIRAEATSLPGIMILTSDNQRYGIGPNIKSPSNVVFSDIPLTLLSDRYGLLWSFFYTWNNQIFNWDSKIENSKVPKYTTQYRKTKTGYNYVTDISIIVYDLESKPRIKIKLIEAYPMAIPSTPLDWSANDQLLKLQVSFTFKSWVTEEIEMTALSTQPTTTDQWNLALSSNLSAKNPATNFV